MFAHLHQPSVNFTVPGYLIKMPDIVFRWRLAAQATCIIGTVVLSPAADGLVGDDDPPLQQHFFNIAQAQPEPVIKPDGMSNDFDREAMVLVGGACFDHANLTYRQTVKPKSM
ncbi:hypothetical protein MesoLjLb_65840 [Mesorhizobium sp. L-8-3]|nr:hypothetical protein MesoLjLb_65840 [Mesorhizobium sp. L-8-3]